MLWLQCGIYYNLSGEKLLLNIPVSVVRQGLIIGSSFVVESSWGANFFSAANHCFLECSSGAKRVWACPSEGFRKLTLNPFLLGWPDPENADLNDPLFPFVAPVTEAKKKSKLNLCALKFSV